MIAIVLRDYNAVFLCHCWFFIYSMMKGLLIWKNEPFWQDVGVESFTLRWPLKPVGFLFIKLWVITSSWWIDKWFYTIRDDAGGYIKLTSEFSLYTDMTNKQYTPIYHVVITSWQSVYIWMNTNMEFKYFEFNKNYQITSLSLSRSLSLSLSLSLSQYTCNLPKYPLKMFYNVGRQ